jgi:ribose transport system substrate-binding protein
MKSSGRWAVYGVSALAAALVLAGCSSGGSSSSASKASDAGSAKKYKVALSMSYSGNDWQSTARNLILAASKVAPLKDKIQQMDVQVAGTDPQAQISQLQQMIAAGYNAIVLYPISPTALNPTIRQACDAGIVVVAYDSEVTEPCAYNVTFDQAGAGEKTASYLADLMGNKGNVVMITGVAGATADTDRTAAAEKVFKQRGIKILDKCAGNWAQGPAGECMKRFFAAFNNIDGVWAQAGGVAIPDAFDAARKPYVPMIAEAENVWRLRLQDPAYVNKGLKGASYGSPQYQGAAALKTAIDVLDGKKLDHKILIDYSWVPQAQVKICPTGSIDELKAGCNTFPPNLVSSGFFADWYSPDFTPGLDLNSALTGKPPVG